MLLFSFFALWASTELIIVIAGHFQICVRHPVFLLIMAGVILLFIPHHHLRVFCSFLELTGQRMYLFFSLFLLTVSVPAVFHVDINILGQCQSNTTRVQVAHTCHSWRLACLCCYISGVVSFENQLVGWRWRQAMSNDCG